MLVRHELEQKRQSRILGWNAGRGDDSEGVGARPKWIKGLGELWFICQLQMGRGSFPKDGR